MDVSENAYINVYVRKFRILKISNILNFLECVLQKILSMYKKLQKKEKLTQCSTDDRLDRWEIRKTTEINERRSYELMRRKRRKTNYTMLMDAVEGYYPVTGVFIRNPGARRSAARGRDSFEERAAARVFILRADVRPRSRLVTANTIVCQ